MCILINSLTPFAGILGAIVGAILTNCVRNQYENKQKNRDADSKNLKAKQTILALVNLLIDDVGGNAKKLKQNYQSIYYTKELIFNSISNLKDTKDIQLVLDIYSYARKEIEDLEPRAPSEEGLERKTSLIVAKLNQLKDEFGANAQII